ncbi:MAG: Gfo/Idh/MocA family oxidoreductase, partial [Verrucomicrobiaceae bacterium]
MDTNPARPLGFGIVGTGMIAGATAEAIFRSRNARVAAVSSRRRETAEEFAAKFAGAAGVEGLEALLGCAEVEAVYLAAPTAFREEMALAVIAAGKHLLIEKPFVSHASALRLVRAAEAKGVAFMDATHFVHHPRTAAIQEEGTERIGTPRSLHTAFYFPLSDRSNIRFDLRQEPMTALGDMAWYSVRAAVE